MTLFLGLAVALIVGAVAVYVAPKGFRTVVSNVFYAGLAILAPLVTELQVFPWGDLLDDRAATGALLGITIMNIILRSVTTTPVGQSK